MSVYLGNQKVSITRNVGEGGLDPEIMAELNDAVGWRVGDYSERTIAQMIEKMKINYFQNRQRDYFYNYNITPWTRPQDWPDLDSLNLQMSGDDFIYMTYDNTHGESAIALHVEKVTNGKNIIVELGHIEDGIYISDESISGTNNNYVRWLTINDENYPVVRVTGDIKYCYCYSATNSNTGAVQHYRRQQMVERIAYVPHLVAFCTGYSSNAWTVFSLQREKVNNGDGTALTSLYYAWAHGRDLRELDISGLKTQNVTTITSAFRQLLGLRELNLSHLTVDKVKDFSSTFYDCRTIRSINLNTWNTIAATNLASMFQNCFAVREINNIENFKTNLVTSLSSTFNSCRSLAELDLTKWDTSNVINLSSIFSGCEALKELDLSTWNVNKVTNCSSVFNGCYSLKRINLSGWQTGTLTTIYSLFGGCWSLEKVDLSWINITSACTDICYVFNNCYSIKEINLPVWDVSGVVGTGNRSHSIFSGCYSVEKITGISNWNFQHTNTSTGIFNNCYCLKELDVSNWHINGSTNLSNCFNNCYCLKELNLSKWQPENCTTFAGMFNGCSSLITVGNISKWNTSKVTSMANMFHYCTSLKEIPNMSTWDFSLVTTMGGIFSECYGLQSVTWTNINLPVCTDITQLFRYNYNLKYVNLSGWNIPSVTNNTTYYQTLGDCWSLRDVIGFPIPSAYTHIGFANCEQLSHNSLLTILNALPQVSSTHTIHITALTANTLTTTEKTIATNKGWTIAA